MANLRDIILHRRRSLAAKQDKRYRIRGEIAPVAGSIWANQNALIVWFLPREGGTPGRVYCRSVFPYAGMPVEVEFVEGVPVGVIKDIDPFMVGQDHSGSPWLAKHHLDHEWTGRDTVWLYPEAVPDLSLQPGTGLSITIIAGDYEYNGERKTFAGEENHSVSVAQPASGNHRLVGFYLDKNNALQTASGSTVAVGSTAPEPSWPAGAYELGVVDLDGDRTEFSRADIDNRKLPWAAFGSGAVAAPAYGEIRVLTSSGGIDTYDSLAAAAAGISGSQNVVLIGPGAVGTFPCDEVDFSGVLAFIGAGVDVTNIHTASDSFYAFDPGTGRIYNMTIINQSSKATRIYGIKSGSTAVRHQNVKIRTNNTGAGASTCLDSFGTTIITPDFQAQSSTGTDDIGLMAYDNIIIHGGVIEARGNGASVDEDSVFGGVVTLVNAPKLIDETGAPESIENGGSMEGQYIDGDGVLVTLDESGFNIGIWLIDKSTGKRLKKPSLAQAITDAAAGDRIYVENDLTVSATPDVSKAIVLEFAPGVILTCTGGDHGILVSAAATLINIKTINTNTSTSANISTGIKVEASATLIRCIGRQTDGEANRRGIWITGASDAVLDHCEGYGSGGGGGERGLANHSTGTVRVVGGYYDGADDDIVDTSGATTVLEGPTLANGVLTISATWAGKYYDLANDKTVLFGDIYPTDDIYGLWARTVNYGFTPGEHWAQNTDQLSWTGYAAYTGFGTPSTITTSDSIYRVASSSNQRWFRYRSAATGNHIYLRSRAGVTQFASAGVMIDDGTDTGDGQGANNFIRAFLYQAALGGPVTAVVEYRTGGGSVTTTSATFELDSDQFHGIMLHTSGTAFSSWQCAPSIFGESGERLQFTGGTGTHTWTPARVGIFGANQSGSGAQKGLYDWYDEAIS